MTIIRNAGDNYNKKALFSRLVELPVDEPSSLKPNQIYVRPPWIQDHDFFYQLRNGDLTSSRQAHFNSERGIAEWISKANQDIAKKNSKRMWFVVENQYLFPTTTRRKEQVGALCVRNFDRESATCELLVEILERKRGRGFGRAAALLVIDWFFSQFSQGLVSVEVASKNEPSLKLFRSLGFLPTMLEGKIGTYKGECCDVVTLCLTKKEYDELEIKTNW